MPTWQTAQDYEHSWRIHNFTRNPVKFLLLWGGRSPSMKQSLSIENPPYLYLERGSMNASSNIVCHGQWILLILLTLGNQGCRGGYSSFGILENSGQSSLVSELGLVLVGKWQCWRVSPLAFLSSVADDPLVDIGGRVQPSEIFWCFLRHLSQIQPCRMLCSVDCSILPTTIGQRWWLCEIQMPDI